MVEISVYIYSVKILKRFRWESGFLKGGSMMRSWCWSVALARVHLDGLHQEGKMHF